MTSSTRARSPSAPRLLDLGVLLGRARRRVRSDVAAELAASPGGTLWWQVLRHLVAEGAATQNELAEIAAQHAATVSRELKQMEKAGLVRRARDRTDRRCSRVEATALGRRRLAAWSPLVLTGLERSLGRLSMPERQLLGGLLHKIVD